MNIYKKIGWWFIHFGTGKDQGLSFFKRICWATKFVRDASKVRPKISEQFRLAE